ncbi:MAG: malate synthase A, partial [Geminicoccaceae bacterium]
WRRHGARIEGGPVIDEALIRRLLEEELAKIRESVGEERFGAGRFEEAATLFRDLVLAEEFAEFLTLPAYERVTTLS